MAHKKINAAGLILGSSFAGRLPEPKPEPKQSNTMSVEQWDAKAGKFVTRLVEVPK